MELYATKKQISDFLEEEAPENGVIILNVGYAAGDDWWLVMTSDKNFSGGARNKVVKLARNVDDLQYDYYWDWECYVDPSTEAVMGNETILDGKESRSSINLIARAFLDEIKSYEKLERAWKKSIGLL